MITKIIHFSYSGILFHFDIDEKAQRTGGVGEMQIEVLELPAPQAAGVERETQFAGFARQQGRRVECEIDTSAAPLGRGENDGPRCTVGDP